MASAFGAVWVAVAAAVEGAAAAEAAGAAAVVWMEAAGAAAVEAGSTAVAERMVAGCIVAVSVSAGVGIETQLVAVAVAVVVVVVAVAMIADRAVPFAVVAAVDCWQEVDGIAAIDALAVAAVAGFGIVAVVHAGVEYEYESQSRVWEPPEFPEWKTFRFLRCWTCSGCTDS